MITADTDEALVARCRRGDGAAWRLLVARYQRLVHAIALRAGLDEHASADIFQTVFARLLDHLPRLAQPDRLQAWIVTTAKREAWRAVQVSRRAVSLTAPDGDAAEGPSIEEAIPDDSPLAEDALDRLQQLALLRDALDRLDERCADLLRLLFRDEDERPDYTTIAGQLGMPVGGIGPTRARCLGKLRRLFDTTSPQNA